MTRAVLTSAVVLMSVGSAAFAQTSPSSATSPVGSPPAKAVASSQTSKTGVNVRQQLRTDLEQAGFTNIRVVADSFLVQATDKSGNPVTMFLRPDSMTIISEAETNGQNAQTGGRSSASITTKDELSSQVVGLNVYNSANQNIGTIKDVAFNADGLKAYIVGVGGYLGLGEHHVAVRPSEITLSYNTSDKRWRAETDITAEQLKAAPDSITVTAQTNVGGQFTSVQPTDDLNSQVVGLNVYNSANQNIGSIKDVAFNANGVRAYIVGVGGYLGLGERYAALRPAAITLSYNASDKKWHAAIDMNAEQLKAIPEYRYSIASN